MTSICRKRHGSVSFARRMRTRELQASRWPTRAVPMACWQCSLVRMWSRRVSAPCPATHFRKLPREADTTARFKAILATDKVRHVGDRVAVVIAETLAQAKNAAELVVVDYAPLPAVTLADATKSDAPKVWDNSKNNISFEHRARQSRGGRGTIPQGHACHVAHNRLSARVGKRHRAPQRDRLQRSRQQPFDAMHQYAGAVSGTAKAGRRVADSGSVAAGDGLGRGRRLRHEKPDLSGRVSGASGPPPN